VWQHTVATLPRSLTRTFLWVLLVVHGVAAHDLRALLLAPKVWTEAQWHAHHLARVPEAHHDEAHDDGDNDGHCVM